MQIWRFSSKNGFSVVKSPLAEDSDVTFTQNHSFVLEKSLGWAAAFLNSFPQKRSGKDDCPIFLLSTSLLLLLNELLAHSVMRLPINYTRLDY
ncbi:hypothetical protein [Fictibacillus terranigra]|uniref:Uncharacterized protein n=1 Tax=Fictibacillus terranigra TaxID=3058424 RepID=A0ABT8E1E2_9BACL|nr:hypothetical protein [Fictibacillus sp. CENA-BCM004]MDN4071710.1 hypothetical protein [Fictibacillus sp. CENA-BCM004]